MNTTALLAPWGQPLTALTVEIALLFVTAFVLQRFVRAAAMRRTIWQAALLGMPLLVMIEISGMSQLLPVWRTREIPRSPTRVLVQTPMPGAVDLGTLLAKREEGTAALDVVPARQKTGRPSAGSSYSSPRRLSTPPVTA